MQKIKIASEDTLQAPPQGQPESPANIPPAAETPVKPLQAGPAPLKNTVSETDALKGVQGSKVSTLLPLTPLGQSSGANQPGTGASVSMGAMMDGKLATELMDAIAPAVFVAILAAIGMKLKKTDLQMTEKEKSTVAPVLQKCLDSLFLNFNSPWSALGVTLAVIYGSKITEKGVVQYLDKKEAMKNIASLEKETADNKNAPYTAPVINMKEKFANVADPNKPPPSITVEQAGKTVTWEPTNEMIQAVVKSDRCTRKYAIAKLKKMYALKQLDENGKPFKKK